MGSACNSCRHVKNRLILTSAISFLRTFICIRLEISRMEISVCREDSKDTNASLRQSRARSVGPILFSLPFGFTFDRHYLGCRSFCCHRGMQHLDILQRQVAFHRCPWLFADRVRKQNLIQIGRSPSSLLLLMAEQLKRNCSATCRIVLDSLLYKNLQLRF